MQDNRPGLGLRFRRQEGLRSRFRALPNLVADSQKTRRPKRDARNLRCMALLLARCALAPTESRGAHFRSGDPEKRPSLAARSIEKIDSPCRFRIWPRSIALLPKFWYVCVNCKTVSDSGRFASAIVICSRP